jgi:hypothetical protein
MHQRRRRDALLGGVPGHRREKLEIFHLDAVRMTEFSGHDKLGWRTLHVRVGILKMLGGVRQQSFDDFYAGDLTEKIRVPEGTAKFAIGYPGHADVFLHFDRIANAAVFDLAQLRGAYFSFCAFFPGRN